MLISLCDDEVFVSLNATSADEYKGAAFASGCVRDYGDEVLFTEKDGSSMTGHCHSHGITVSGNDDSDYNIARSGKIAVSLIYAEPVFKKVSGKTDFVF